MNILVGNNHLAKTGGTENYTFALALELKRQGHNVEYFTFEKGEISDRLEKEGVLFKSKEKYDLVLANHNTVIKELAVCGFIIQTCHGCFSELEQPSPYADAYVSISNEIKDYLDNKGFSSTLILNGIDCNRFSPKKPLHTKLQTVLSLCQSDKANEFIKHCCDSLQLQFLSCNKHIENIWNIEDYINQSDLVVGIGRSAYDAMACGRCVVSYDHRDYMNASLGDGIILPETIEKSIYYNFSGRGTQKTFDENEFIAELQKYNPEIGAWCREYALTNLNIEYSAKKYLSIYENNNNYLTYDLKKKIYSLIKNFTEKQESAEAAHKQQVYSLQNQVSKQSEKTRKHLFAIRLLGWSLFIVLVILLILLLHER